MSWHLKREVGIGHIVSTLMLTVMLIGGYVRIEKQMQKFDAHISRPAHTNAESRLDAVEKDVTRLEANDTNMQRRLDALAVEIIRRLERIEDAVNRHIADK